MQKFLAIAQHAHSAQRSQRIIRAANAQAAETQALRELANTDWYLAGIYPA